MSWFKTWFNTTLYEEVYAYRDETEAAKLADLVESLIPRDRFPALLDLACGRGRHSLNMAKRGYHVTGVDLAPAAIQTARKKVASEELTNVTFTIGDMRDPAGGPYDAILNLFTSFGYFEEDSENIRVLRNVASMLKPGGVFIQDYLNPLFVRNSLITSEERSLGRITFRIERTIENGMVCKKLIFPGDEQQPPSEFTERVQLYDLSWFKEELQKCGLSLQETFGDYEGASFDPEESSRMVMVSRKSG